MKKYRYIGAQPHISTILIVNENESNRTMDLNLHPGDEMELPSSHPTVSSLIRTGHLIEIKPNSANQTEK